MSDIILHELANGEICLENLKKWLLFQDNEIEFTCSQNEFLTYFLNFVHEDINNQKKFGGHTIKFTPRKIKPGRSENFSKRSCMTLEKSSCSALSPVQTETSFTDADSSTPKVFKTQTTSLLNNSFCSPVSPLQREEISFNSPRNKSTICLGDFLIKKPSSKKKVLLRKAAEDSSKRITPTNLNYVKTNESFKSVNSFNNFNTKEVLANEINHNRMFLAKERLKILSRRDSEDTSLQLNSKKLSISENRDEIEPALSLVTYQNQLNILSDVYILILKNNFVLNITGEIYFLISLLLTKQYHLDSIDLDDTQIGIDFLNEEDKNNLDLKSNIIGCSDYFESVHNIVYFSVRCLETQLDVLKYYDKSSLKLLSESKRVKEFSVKFSEMVRKISEKKSDRSIQIFEGNANVCYNLDTDTKNNFMSEISFLSFRKQRDLFYEIIRVWEKNHLLPGWNFQIGLGEKIKGLLNLQPEPLNFMHFARLFKAQLLSSCGKSSMEGDENYALPSSFPSIDPNKLNRLKNRLVTKQTTNSLNALPLFVGQQEFYKEFILVAANHSFNIHLSNVLISEILELNEHFLNCVGFGESDTDVDATMRESYALKLRNLRVLAKFLGFIESIPYKSDCNINQEHVLNHLIKIREKKTPSLDIKQILLTSIKLNTVVLMIPWLVKYLSMLDYVTLRLPYYLSIYKILFQIYQSYEKSAKNFDYNASLVKFSLGWLFDLPHFPDTEYTRFCSYRNAHFIRKANTLDDLHIVDQSILYLCCPYLEEIKKMLTSISEYHKVTVKHITPVTAVESSEQISKKRLDQQLEEAFFNGQPDSVRKTVEFVSERLASACVKHICTSLVPQFKKATTKEIQEFLEVQQKEITVLSPLRERNQKAVLRMKVSQLAQEKLAYLRTKCGTELTAILSDKIPKSMDILLALEILIPTRKACISIASRLCRERIKQWINSHLTINIFMKDIDRELQKWYNIENRKLTEEKQVFVLPSAGRKENHNEETLSGFHMLDKIKTLAMNLHKNSKIMDEEDIIKVLDEVSKSMAERCDLNDIIISNSLNSLLDLAILITIYSSDFMSHDHLPKKFVNIWRSYCPSTDDLFKNILCPRNISLLNESTNQKKAWSEFAIFIAFLIKEKVLSCDNFESQCTAFFREELEQSTLENVCYFMRYFLECYKQNRGDYNKFMMLMEFLSDFCQEL